MKKKYLLFTALSLVHSVFGQESVFKIPNTIRTKNYDYFFDRIEESENNNFQKLLYLKSFLSKAKSERNWKEIVNGYKNYVYHSPENLKLLYTDSMIYTAKKSMDKALICKAYLSKGIVYYSQKKHNKALDHYLIANSYISKTDDKYLIYKVKYNIANIKYYLGFYDEAITLFKECIDYFKKNNTRSYLNSLYSLSLCYTNIGNYGLCTAVNKKGILEGKRTTNSHMTAYFNHSEGINQFFKNNFSSAIKQINYSLPAIRKNKDFEKESVSYFYIGRSYRDLKKPEIAISYFKKVDSIFDCNAYIRPDLLENYQLLINYYKSKDNLPTQLHYIMKLLKANSIVDHKFKYLSPKINKEYFANSVLLEKKKIENLLEKRKNNDLIFSGVIAVLFLSILLVSYLHVSNKNNYRKKIEELMKENKSEIFVEIKHNRNGVEDINHDTLTALLKQLEKFEKDKKFLEKDLTAAKLTVALGSNAKYISKIIYHSTGKKFVQYINDLKIDYLIRVMKENKRIRNYTNKALAEEVGFSSTQRFANAFFARTGMPTSFFIEELKKEQL